MREQIEVFDSKVCMFNQNIMYRNKGEIMEILKLNGYSNIEQEDYDTFETVFCEEIHSYFDFKFNRLTGIDFGPLFKNDDEIIWPKS